MKGKVLQRKMDNRFSSNDDVLIEIQSFLQALDSYPARFARNPNVSFEEHRASLMELAQSPMRARSSYARKN